MSAVKTVAVEVDGVELLVPAEVGAPPSAFAELVFSHMRNPANWKYATTRFVTRDIARANEVGYALDWYLGGHEVEVAILAGGEPEFTVWSKGYYHYVGA